MEVHVIVVLLLSLIVGRLDADVLSMDIRTRYCGSTFHVHTWKEYILVGTGDFTGTVCNYTFTGEVKENCLGLCYDMQMVAFLNNTKANLTVESETHLQVFVEGMVSTGPWCSKSLKITVTLTVDEGYEYNSSNPGYQFTLAIYNKCGDGDSITYEEAIKHLEGYHHGEMFYETERRTTIHGIIAGASLSATFLVIFGITVIYYCRKRDSVVHRPAVSFKKKMKEVRKESLRRMSQTQANPEVQMKY